MPYEPSVGAPRAQLGSLGSLSELDAHFDRHGLPEPTREAVRAVVLGNPVRCVGGGARNAAVRYASRKMRVVVQAESRTVEGALVQHAEFAPDVYLYLCQPLVLPVYVVDKRGRKRLVRFTVDFLLLTRDGFVLVECKSPSELESDSKRPHPRYVRNGDQWRWPAAEEAARALGLGFWLFTSEDVNPIYLRNMRFLADYLGAPPPSDPQTLQRVLDCVAQAGSVRLVELLEASDFASACIWWLVAEGRLSADLERERLFEPDQAWVHASEARMLAHSHIVASSVSSSCPAVAVDVPESVPVSLDSGARVLWSGVPWTVLHRGPSAVDLQCADGTSKVVSVPLGDAERLMEEGAWRGDPSLVDDRLADRRAELLERAGPPDLDRANARYRVVRHYLVHGRFPPGHSADLGYRYVRWYRQGERSLGSGYLGLIRPRGRRSRERGGVRDLPESHLRVLAEVVEAYAGNPSAGRLSSAYARLVDLCARRGLAPAPSERTLRRAFAELPLAGVARSRLGSRASYQLQGPLPQVDSVALRHGDCAFESGHIDHTQLDLTLVSSRTGAVLGRPWLTVYLDSYSRMPLGFALSFDPPSRASLAAVLYDCLRRHRRVTGTIVFDQALEFQSHMTESALAYLGVHKLERPAHSPRFGSPMERFFHSLNTRCLHEMKGNTKILSLGRGLSSSHHPSRFAAWTLPMAHEVLERWLFQLYPALVHSTLGAAPRDVFDNSCARAGERLVRHVPVDFGLRVLLSQPAPRAPTRVVHPVRGVVVDYLRYFHDDFSRGDVAGTAVPVKLDVADCSVAFAYVRGRWVVCRLVEGDADLYGRSWRQVRLVVAALRGQRRAGREGRRINAELIGAFLRDLDADGDIALQAARDAEAVGLGLPALRGAESPVRLAASDGVRTDPVPPDPAEQEVGGDAADFDFHALEEFNVR